MDLKEDIIHVLGCNRPSRTYWDAFATSGVESKKEGGKRGGGALLAVTVQVSRIWMKHVPSHWSAARG